MISVRFNIFNPWYKPGAYRNRDYFWLDRKIATNKSLEIQISRFDPHEIVGLTLDLTWRGQDHAGPEFEVTVWGYMFHIKIYDHRHWDHEQARWIEYS